MPKGNFMQYCKIILFMKPSLYASESKIITTPATHIHKMNFPLVSGLHLKGFSVWRISDLDFTG